MYSVPLFTQWFCSSDNPVFKWLAIIGNINPTCSDKPMTHQIEKKSDFHWITLNIPYISHIYPIYRQMVLGVFLMFIETDASIDAKKKKPSESTIFQSPNHGCIGIVTAAVVHDNDLVGCCPVTMGVFQFCRHDTIHLFGHGFRMAFSIWKKKNLVKRSKHI